MNPVREYKRCPIHKDKWTYKRLGKDGTEFYSHKQDDGTWCNAQPLEEPNPASNQEDDNLSSDNEGYWDAKDRQSMAQTALNSASQIVSALISLGSVSFNPEEEAKRLANEFYLELKKLKEIK